LDFERQPAASFAEPERKLLLPAVVTSRSHVLITEENNGFPDVIGNPAAPNLTYPARTLGVETGYFGVSPDSESNYVGLLGGNVYGVVSDDAYSSARFRLQEDVTKPMIFVSAGTGFAPMRAFLWERLAMKQSGVSLAEAALFNGIRSSSQDYIYRDEIERFAAEGVLDHVHVATSRERPGRRDYVQDRIREQGALVWRLLAADGYVYVCGSPPMRAAVRAAFIDVVAEHRRLPHEHAEAYLNKLEATTYYRPDLWG
jgi:hypothetical protein